ncbi:OsmC family protein [Pendulispora albinea]|uniref:OsmC family protein n=1 Tax=Pendulispora albinea TaxID=2741071 RepID=A0ABZ2M463_9BACT
MIRKSTAVWKGNGLQGEGALTTQSGVFTNQPYSFKTRFQSEDGKAGTNPEELLGAAHAGCFAMALSFALTDAGHAPQELRVVASVDLTKVENGFAIRTIALELEARVPGLDPVKFQTLAEGAKQNCPVSKALAATPITLNAKLL